MDPKVVAGLLVSDLHQTDNVRDADRWNIFPWLREKVKKYKVGQVGILGDTTDAKDRHSEQVVNRLTDEIYELSQLCQVIILPGNHDGIDASRPFFRFIRRLKGNVKYITKPTELTFMDEPALWLPHTKNYEKDWADYSEQFGAYRYIFCHQTFDGALAENGIALRGIPPSLFNSIVVSELQVWSGDIHVPQKIGGRIEYVGSPYRVHFGDTFNPRVPLLDAASYRNLHFPGKGRELILAGNIEDVEGKDFEMGTQVKIRVKLHRADYPEWPELKRGIKKLVADRGWELCGLKLEPRKTKEARGEEDEVKTERLPPEDELRSYAKRKKADKPMIRQGLEFLEEAQRG